MSEMLDVKGMQQTQAGDEGVGGARETDRDSERQRETERERVRVCSCACAVVCVQLCVLGGGLFHCPVWIESGIAAELCVCVCVCVCAVVCVHVCVYGLILFESVRLLVAWERIKMRSNTH